MGLISFTQKGDFKNTEKFLHGGVTSKYVRILERYGEEGVKALSAATPVDTGELRDSWQPPERLGLLNWRISNIAPHAYVIDGGRRQAMVNGTIRWVGSEQLPKGFQPIIDEFEPKLQRELDKIK